MVRMGIGPGVRIWFVCGFVLGFVWVLVCEFGPAVAHSSWDFRAINALKFWSSAVVEAVIEVV